jgi:hypothetical protein
MSTDAAWLPLVEAIEYVASESEQARAWVLDRFKDGTDPLHETPLFDGPIAADVLKELRLRGFGRSLWPDAIEAIKNVAMAGKLPCRGVVPFSTRSEKIEAGEWAQLEISAEGEAFRVQKSGVNSMQISQCVVWQNIVVEGRQLRRLFPRSSGKGGTQAAETDCRAWLKSLTPFPVRKKEAVRQEGKGQWGDKLSDDAFDRAWKAGAPKEWKKPGRPRKIRGT